MPDKKDKEESIEVKLYLAGLLFDTPEDRMAELTNIPLNQVTPLSLEAMLEDGRHLLAGKIARSVVRTKLIWAERSMRALLEDKATVKSNSSKAIELVVQEEALKKVIDGLKLEIEMVKPDEGQRVLLITKWRGYYHQYRRSVPGLLNHKMALATLTQEELARDFEEDEDAEDFK